MFLIELAALFVTLLGVLIIKINIRSRQYPKGPIVFPVIGNLPQMMWHWRAQPQKNLYDKYRHIYGKVFSLQMGPFPSVILTDHKLVREAWNNLQICGRPKLHDSAARTGGVIRGILLQDGQEWSEQRRFALRHLKDFGFGKRSMENMIMDEVFELIEGFKKDAGKPISTQTRFNVAVLNSFWAIVAGQRYSHEDPRLQELVKNLHRSLEFSGLVFFYPLLKDYFPKLSGWEEYVQCMTLIYDFVKEFVQGRIAVHDDEAEPEDFTGVFIEEIRRTKDDSSSFYKERGEETLVATLQDLFAAGIETMGTSLSYTLLYMAIYPEIQTKVHEEIDRVIGSRTITLDDRRSMPYVEAMILEMFRFSSVVPSGMFHKTFADVVLGDYHIPKDTWIIANLQGIHRDPEIWGDPQNFRPERFLNEKNDVIRNHEALLPFSFGKRVCIGESLARDELFLFITGIFQAFTVKPDPECPPSTEQISLNIIAMPKAHKLILKERKLT